MASDGASKAVATEAWSQLVTSVLSWTPPSDMSMEYYYTLPEDNSNRLDFYKYKLGTENIQARIKSGVHSQVVHANEHGYQQGIEYIHDCIRSTNDYYVVKASEREDQQGIEYVQDCIRSTNDYYVVKASDQREDQQGIGYVQDCIRSTNDYYVVQENEGENQQGIEDIQACMRSTNHNGVLQADVQENQQVIIEPTQHSIGSTVLFMPKPAENKDHQSLNNITEFMRSQGLPKELPEPEIGNQQWIHYEQVKKMSTLFDDLFKFIENYNMNGVEKPTLRFQVLEVIKLLHHYGIDTIRSGVEEELEYVNKRNDAIEKNSATHYKKKALEVMLRICDIETCQSSIYEVIGKAERDQVLYEW